MSSDSNKLGFDKVKKVKIEYIKPQGYNPSYITGVLGGATPKSDILIHFYTDLSGLPESQHYNIVDGKLGTEIINKRVPSIISSDNTVTLYRQIQSGIIVSLNEAKSMVKWLNEQIDALELHIIKNNGGYSKEI